MKNMFEWDGDDEADERAITEALAHFEKADEIARLEKRKASTALDKGSPIKKRRTFDSNVDEDNNMSLEGSDDNSTIVNNQPPHNMSSSELVVTSQTGPTVMEETGCRSQSAGPSYERRSSRDSREWMSLVVDSKIPGAAKGWLKKEPKRPLAPQLVRKFPGPAGLLPVIDEETSKLPLQPIEKPKKGLWPNLWPHKTDRLDLTASSSNTSGSVRKLIDLFERKSNCTKTPWQKLSLDFGFDDPSNPLGQYNIAWVKRQAASHQLIKKKVPFLAGIFRAIDRLSADPVIILEDETGMINGTVHREVLEAHGDLLVPGTAIALHRLGVVTTGAASRRPHLNITLNNVISIYSCQENDISGVNVFKVNDIKRRQLIEYIRRQENAANEHL